MSVRKTSLFLFLFQIVSIYGMVGIIRNEFLVDIGVDTIRRTNFPTAVHTTEAPTTTTTATTTTTIPPPPPLTDDAGMARYIVHFTDWCSLAHISLQKETYKFPKARVFSISDGPLLINSTGIPYIYGPLIDDDIRDLMDDNRCSITTSLASGSYCKNQHWDAEDPRCGQVILTGQCKAVPNNTAEWKFAFDSLVLRHPIMKTWPKSHNWVVIRIHIDYVTLVDYFGGNKHPSVLDYFNASPFPHKSGIREDTSSNEIVNVELIS